ncbi:EscU/YscU/HrcU family type III secretion system export apparatus switch protein [Cognatazoarcus halotolerans]|uniref:EscU/YscU/HrcU family type III secretion system export apparatus switch protein n=1 Tax=Cognatazoarcus halotolerans TaxID=2686016 RepID=UPI001357ACA3|nr:EscU/YscU/HrcU family type III secretion system export apparatus switch protein [Cognatazoarcus halotolerans]MBX3679224.1 EscU/YscU/HrcU family type III secretion system export apparatus switch protein [Rhodocyclaceae bacterium]MCB1901971.1 EscU/YscU/HrcU family type III secretion system export apparatus switch protein [Rhodocyclaceae bacterium]MCP5310023.1 EscU/YscU/HrcU family type III secretion system export apparatus switch protein [Zoogloeaceae bacterium]
MAKADKTPARAEAVALAYTAGEAAPRVVAKGHGLIARQIIERAREAGVYVHESPEMVSLLMQVDLDARIPPQLYVAIAELLAWLYRIEQGGTAPAPVPQGLPESLRPRPATPGT